jgi:hypothetical protein
MDQIQDSDLLEAKPSIDKQWVVRPMAEVWSSNEKACGGAWEKQIEDLHEKKAQGKGGNSHDRCPEE